MLHSWLSHLFTDPHGFGGTLGCTIWADVRSQGRPAVPKLPELQFSGGHQAAAFKGEGLVKTVRSTSAIHVADAQRMLGSSPNFPSDHHPLMHPKSTLISSVWLRTSILPSSSFVTTHLSHFHCHVRQTHVPFSARKREKQQLLKENPS